MSDSRDNLLGRFDKILADKPKLVIPPHEAGKLADLHRIHPGGCDVVLAPGEFFLRQTVLLASGTRIRGSGRGVTTLTLEPGSNCHMLQNAVSRRGTDNIGVGNMSIVGNGDRQDRPDGVTTPTFACAFHFSKANSVIVEDIDFFDIRQTAIHFNHCVNVVVESVICRRLGWSGVSSANGSNIYFRRTVIEDAGRDIKHSGIHVDGGFGVFIDAQVSDTTGHGIMLGSSRFLLQGCVVQGSVERCFRGVSLNGSDERPIEQVVIRGSYCRNREAGVGISNASNVAVIGARIEENAEFGILIVGKSGGKNCLISDCKFLNNGAAIRRPHPSSRLCCFPELVDTEALFNSDINLRGLRDFSDEEIPRVRRTPWFARG